MGDYRRTAVIGGLRTPFVKAGTVFKDYSMQELGVHVLKAIWDKYSLSETSVDRFTFGTVLLDPRTPNWAREILFAAGLPKTIYAHSVSNNCISGLVAINDIVNEISLGRMHCGLAGGTESMSNPSLTFSSKAAKTFLALSRARTLGDRVKLCTRFRPGHFLPSAPSIAEPSTGLTMGQHMELTAKEFKIAREPQDELAYKSHKNAAEATSDGRLTAEIAPLDGINNDLLIRKDTSIEKLSLLKPVFDRSGSGTLTAGNSSALTDGASVVLLMSEDKARQENHEILAFIKDSEYAAIAPADGLLMAPGIAVPRLLKRNGLTLEDIDLIEVHEAFAAQVLANIKVWEEGWKEEGVGHLDRAKLNTLGGSIALGHPFAATGGRIITTLANELKRKSLKRGLISICAAGAMACAMLLERD